jgi:hypothetical protein
MRQPYRCCDAGCAVGWRATSHASWRNNRFCNKNSSCRGSKDRELSAYCTQRLIMTLLNVCTPS